MDKREKNISPVININVQVKPISSLQESNAIDDDVYVEDDALREKREQQSILTELLS